MSITNDQREILEAFALNVDIYTGNVALRRDLTSADAGRELAFCTALVSGFDNLVTTLGPYAVRDAGAATSNRIAAAKHSLRILQALYGDRDRLAPR